ncbi:glutamyl aminopeptidase [Boleophthalmus pectinirostris]|uniref:glutamyl aminopeptidase n=1 Tax=Boleophthalmus pectinirostris TaxID=150288 RepID=UPI00242FE538|nr:glutamyl aminopeptidase [Boleophthalmus pectinirostris]
MNSLDFEKQEKRYCIQGKHVAIICATVAVCSLVVGLAVGLSKTSSETSPPPTLPPTGKPPTQPTKPPTQPPQTSTQPPQPSKGPCLPSEDSTGDWKNFRLPNYVNPVHYDLHLEPNMVDDTYSGTVDIQVEVTQTTKHLWLHIRETYVSALPRLRAGASQEDGASVGVTRCFEYKTHEYVVVEAETTLAPGNYVLSLDFKGVLTGSVVGFYRVVYIEGGVTKKIAATDHEPTDARKSFPCFDEPNKKATYTVSITHDKAYKALANMPQEGESEVLPGDKLKTSFIKSVPMSTYLVCFAVHQFESVQRISARGIPLKIWAQPSQLHTAVYAADTTKIIFDYFEEYFNMNYSISKLDKIAIPDFGTGAMENWGLITYRETNLLYDEKESSSTNKQRVASVIAHELVHQWFGNIVTMDWWDDLWLNEGFASFFEYVGVEQAEPTWGMRDIMIISDVLPVMEDDALLSSHPIIVDVSTPAEITSVFDAISYSKGASVLRMLEDWMGKNMFRDGCRQYLKDYYFTNAKTANFWASLAKASGLPVAEVMDTWTQQMGYPVVMLSVTETAAKLTQKRFLLDPNADISQPPTPLGYKWTMPVEFHAIKSNRDFMAMFNKTESELVVPPYSSAVDGLLKVNNDHIGFYRVNHDEHVWTSISQQLLSDHTEFDAADRTSFIDDVFALARGDIIDYGNAFNLTQYLTNETEYIVWKTVATSISYVREMLSNNDALYPKFQKLFRNHVTAIATKLGWEDVGDQKTRLLRETVLGIACGMGDDAALNEASRLFDQWIDGTLSSVAVNLRLLVYRYGMKRSGTAAKWETMFQRYTTSTLAQEKDKLLYGLASVEDVNLLYRLLEASKDESVVRSQDLFTLVRYVSYNPLGQSMAWDWTTLNWDYLVDRYTINDRNLGRLLGYISTSYNTDLQLWKMEHFFKMTPNAGAGEMPRKQALETVRNNIEWLRRNQDEIKLWLDNNVV